MHCRKTSPIHSFGCILMCCLTLIRLICVNAASQWNAALRDPRLSFFFLLETESSNIKLTCFIKEEGILILLQVLRGSGLIQKQRVRPLDVLHLNFCPLKKPKHTHHQHWSRFFLKINSWSSAYLVTKWKNNITDGEDWMFTLSLPCACDTLLQQCWSGGLRSAATSPCQCELKPSEPLRSARHPPPRSWNKTVTGSVSVILMLRERRRTQTLTGSWGSASSLSRCRARWWWWADDPAGRWGCRGGCDSSCHECWKKSNGRCSWLYI